MGLFGTRKARPGAAKAAPAGSGGLVIEVLGGGCKNCDALEAATAEALAALGLDVAVGHIRDYGEIAARGVMRLPALMVNGKVVSSGRVLKKDQVAAVLKKELGENQSAPASSCEETGELV